MQTHKTWLWLIPLLLLTFWLGVHYMDARPIWLDEANSLIDAGDALRSPIDIWNLVAVRNPWHPPGFFVLLNGWERLVGRAAPGLRILSLLFGLLAVTFTYCLGRDHISRQVGLYASVLLGTGVMFAFYLNQIRVYTLLTLLSTVTLWLYLRIARMRGARLRDWLFLLMGVTGILYSHYFGAIILGVIGLYHVIFVPKNRHWWTIVGVFAAGGLLFLPWVGVLIEALHRFTSPQGYNSRALSNGEVIEALATLFSNGLVILLIAVLVLSLLSRLRNSWRMWFFATTILLSLLAINAFARVILMTRLRYLLIAWPLFALVAASGIVWLGQHGRVPKGISLLILLLWAGAGVANVDNPALISGLGGGGSYFPYQHIVRQLRDQANEDDAIITFWWAEDRPSAKVINYYNKLFPTRPVIVTAKKGEVQSVDPEEFSNKNRLWLAYVPELSIDEPEAFDRFKSQLSNYSACGKASEASDLTIEVYARSSACCGPNETPPVSFGDRSISLTGYEQTDEPGKALITLGWSIDSSVPDNVYSVTLQIFDKTGEKVGQSDYGLPARAFACQTTPLDIALLTPGQYDIRVGVYEWQTGRRLEARSADGLVAIGTVTLH